MRVRTIVGTDAGVGFLIDVDGLVIFHAGDHANGEPGLDARYTDEIDYLAEALSCITQGKYAGRYTQERATGEYTPEGWHPDFSQYFRLV